MQFLQIRKTFLAAALIASCTTQASEPLDVNQADSTTVNLYRDRALVVQHFKRSPDEQGRLPITGLPTDSLNSSLSLAYGDNAMLPKRITWPRTESNRDGYYHALVGKQVEVLGYGRTVAGKLLNYHMGTGWVIDDNKRQYFVDLNDPRGLRMQALEPVRQEKYPTAYFEEQPDNQALTLSYITSQLNFQSHYRLTLSSANRGQLTLKALLSNGSNLDFTHAAIRLIANDESVRRFSVMSMAEAVPLGGSDYGHRVSEVLLTTLKTGLAANSTQLIDLVAANVAIEKQYIIDVYSRENLDQRPRLALKFTAPVDLPAAEVSVYEQNVTGAAIISGDAWLAKTARNETASILLNEALTVGLERRRTGQKADQIQWQAMVSNDQQEPVTLYINERDASLLKLEKQPGVKLNGLGQIQVEVAAGARQTIKYTAIYAH